MPNNHYFERVFQVTSSIPHGRITTYGAIADFLALGSARMVGWALNASHVDESIPAHRVVNRKGLLTGKHHFKGTNLMQQLLESEGIEVRDHAVLDFSRVFWDPNSQ